MSQVLPIKVFHVDFSITTRAHMTQNRVAHILGKNSGEARKVVEDMYRSSLTYIKITEICRVDKLSEAVCREVYASLEAQIQKEREFLNLSEEDCSSTHNIENMPTKSTSPPKEINLGQIVAQATKELLA